MRSSSRGCCRRAAASAMRSRRRCRGSSPRASTRSSTTRSACSRTPPCWARSSERASCAQALGMTPYAAVARVYELWAGLAGETDPGRARALLGHALALKALSDDRRFDLLEEAASTLVASGDVDGAAEAEAAL